MNFLEIFGYRKEVSLEAKLEQLRERFNCICPCPHEIGIFLGIPLEDVKGFILKPETECLLNGYWRVYSNLESAKLEFKRYDLIKNNFIKSIIRYENPILINNIKNSPFS
jgi:hypothetical protein